MDTVNENNDCNVRQDPIGGISHTARRNEKLRRSQSQVREMKKKIGSLEQTVGELTNKITELKHTHAEVLSEKTQLEQENNELAALNAELTKILAKVTKERDGKSTNHHETTITSVQYEDLLTRLATLEVENRGLQAVVRRHYTKQRSEQSSECSSMPLYNGQNSKRADPNSKLGIKVGQDDDESDDATVINV